MSDINSQLQNIRFQLKSMDLSFENIITLMKNMNLNNYATQIKTMGVQMINLGIQMLNIGIEIPNMNNDYNDLNILQQIQNISNQIKNIEMKMNNPIQNNMGMNNNMMMNMGMNNNMMMNMGMGINPINDIGMIYNPMAMQMGNPIIGMNIKDNNMMNNMKIKKPKQKINVCFETISRFKKLIIVDYGTSICDMIKKYFNEIGRPELFGNKYICFIYNASKLNPYDNSKVENLFPETFLIHKIIVHDLL